MNDEPEIIEDDTIDENICHFSDMEDDVPKVFLIDMENVGVKGLEGYQILKNGDELHLFIGHSTDKINVNFLATLQKKNVKVVYHDIISHGKNALDFQITTFLGVMVASKQEYTRYYIITQDKGYDSSILFLKDYFNERKLHIQRLDAIISLDETAVSYDLGDTLKVLSQKEKRDEAAKQLINNIVRIPNNYVMDRYKEQTLTNICLKGCKKKNTRDMKMYIKTRLNDSFGKKGEEFYAINKNILSSLYKNVNNLLDPDLETEENVETA